MPFVIHNIDDICTFMSKVVQVNIVYKLEDLSFKNYLIPGEKGEH